MVKEFKSALYSKNLYFFNDQVRSWGRSYNESTSNIMNIDSV